MTWLLPLLLFALAGYVCGATPFGYLAGKLKGIDIRQHGSGNIGATNVIRVCGKGIGIPVFMLDMLKGWLPAWLAQHWFTSHGAGVEWITGATIVAGAAAVMGHNFPFWLRGKGGKGIATSSGAVLALAPWALLIAFIVWFIALKITRYVSLASLVAAVCLPTTMIVMMLCEGQWNFIKLGFGIVLCVLAFVRHTANIQRLIAGTESRVGAKQS